MIPRRAGALLVAITVLLGACSGAPETEAEGDRSRLGGKGGAKGGRDDPREKVLKKAAKLAEKAEARGEGGGLEEGTSARAAGEPPGTTTSSAIVPEYARRSASVDDANNDGQKEGLTPAYSEITRASITGLGKSFRLRLTLDGDVPHEMPNDKTHMVIAFGITGTDEEEGTSFGAQATDEGWTAYAGGKDDSGEFPGEFFINGNEIDMIVPWTYIHGPRAFEWYATSAWFSQLANTTHYKVDLAPNEGLAKFPQ